jgi:Na+/phosphate symporter
MRTKKRLLAVIAAIVGCFVVAWFATSIQGGQKTYELQPRMSIPEYKTDTVRIMDAYERLMDRYMDLTESNSAMAGMDLKTALAKLDSIDARLTELSARMTRIEKALGIGKPIGPLGQSLSSQPNPPSQESGPARPK